MVNVRRIVTTLALSVAMAGGLLAQASPMLNVKLGLWEMTSTIDMSGAMGGVDTSKMTPDQQAMIAGMMRGSMAPTVTKQCMTKEKVSEANFDKPRPGETCTHKVTKSSATVTDVTENCKGDSGDTSTAEMHIEATSSTTVKITGKSTGTMGSRGRGPSTVTFTINGKWLATDCGDVK